MSSEHPEEVSNLDLRLATERLAEQVSALSGALQAVNSLQERQQELERKASAAQQVAAEAKAESVQTTETINTSIKDLATRTAIQRALAQRRLRIFAITTAVVALLIALGAVGFAFKVNRDRINDQQTSRAKLCVQGNQQRIEAAQKERQYFAPKLAAERVRPNADPTLVSILESLANAQPQLLACPKP